MCLFCFALVAYVAENKPSIVGLQIVDRLLQLTHATSSEVVANAVGCATNLVSGHAEMATDALIIRLLDLAGGRYGPSHLTAAKAASMTADSAPNSVITDVRVVRNATGALLNLTHAASQRSRLADLEGVPVLIRLLSHSDPDVVYYATTAVSNLAVDAITRGGALAVHASGYVTSSIGRGSTPMISTLVAHLSPPTPLRLQTQAALALRNLASSTEFQHIILHAPAAVAVLISHAQSEYPPLRLASIACLRNLSIAESMTPRLMALHLRDTFVVDVLVPLIRYDGRVASPLVHQLLATDGTVLTKAVADEIQGHAVSTLRNLAASSSENKRVILERGHVLESFAVVLSRSDTAENVLCEIAAAIAVLATDDVCRMEMLVMGNHMGADALHLLEGLCASQRSIEVMANGIAALANLAARAHPGGNPNGSPASSVVSSVLTGSAIPSSVVGGYGGGGLPISTPATYYQPSPLLPANENVMNEIISAGFARIFSDRSTGARDAAGSPSPVVSAIATLIAQVDDWTLQHLALHAVDALIDRHEAAVEAALRMHISGPIKRLLDSISAEIKFPATSKKPPLRSAITPQDRAQTNIPSPAEFEVVLDELTSGPASTEDLVSRPMTSPHSIHNVRTESDLNLGAQVAEIRRLCLKLQTAFLSSSATS
jgi:hypothetical protein